MFTNIIICSNILFAILKIPVVLNIILILLLILISIYLIFYHKLDIKIKFNIIYNKKEQDRVSNIIYKSDTKIIKDYLQRKKCL